MPHTDKREEWRCGPRDRGLRAADRDRDAVAETLREQHLAGRLESDEFEERIDRCYDAKTYAELDALIADLPPEPRTRPSSRRGSRWPALAFVPLLVALLVLSRAYLLWPAIPLLLFVARPLLFGHHGSGRFGWGCCGGRTRTNL